MHETPRRGYLLRGANDDRAPPRRLQCGDIAEQPSSRHALDKIFQGQADGVEELLDYVAPGEDRDSRCLFALQVRRHAKAVSVPRVRGRWSKYPASVSGAAIAYSSLRLRSPRREKETSW